MKNKSKKHGFHQFKLGQLVAAGREIAHEKSFLM